jgi:hypothetical protein
MRNYWLFQGDCMSVPALAPRCNLAVLTSPAYTQFVGQQTSQHPSLKIAKMFASRPSESGTAIVQAI